MPKKPKDLTGSRFGRFVALKPDHRDGYHKHRYEKHGWLYKVTKEKNGLLEATSVATGYRATLSVSAVEEFEGDKDELLIGNEGNTTTGA